MALSHHVVFQSSLSRRRLLAGGLALTGAWVAGTGIAAVVEHARSRAGRLASAGSAEGAGDAKNAGTGRGRERA
mgnify:FL=1